MVIKNSIGRNTLRVFLSVFLVWSSSYVLNAHEGIDKVVLIIGELYLVYNGIMCFFAVIDRRDKIIIDTQGIYLPGIYDQKIDWIEIKNIDTAMYYGQYRITIKKKNGEIVEFKSYPLDYSFRNLTDYFKTKLQKEVSFDQDIFENSSQQSKWSSIDKSKLDENKRTANADTSSKKNGNLEKKKKKKKKKKREIVKCKTVNENEKFSYLYRFTNDPFINEILSVGILVALTTIVVFIVLEMSGDPAKIGLGGKIFGILLLSSLSMVFWWMAKVEEMFEEKNEEKNNKRVFISSRLSKRKKDGETD